jgi:metal-sulfur cluster biosynthetic enzyme
MVVGDTQETTWLKAIMEGLNDVIDPETGVDLLRLGLIRDIRTEKEM